MMALISIFRLMPRWLYAVIAIAALASAGATYERRRGAEIVQRQWNASKSAIAAAEAKAVAARVADNSKLVIKQAADSAAIQKGHDDEIATLHARIAAALRLRIGAALCSRSAATPDSPGAGGGPGADPGSGLVRDDVDRDIRALMTEVEDALATGRACQSFVKLNGMSQ